MDNTLDAIQPLNLWRRLLSLFTDPVVMTLLLGLSALVVLDRSQALQSLHFSLQSMLQIAPFFILAIAFAGYAKATGIDAYIARAFSGNLWMTIVAASLAGALSPFCSCGVIPLIAAMLASGVPLAPVMAFCIASPIMDPEMFLITASGINLHFALAKTLAAIGMGLGTGFMVVGLQKMGFLHTPLKRAPAGGCCQPTFNPHTKININRRFWRQSQGRSLFMQEIRDNGLFLGKWMVFAFFLESLMVTYLPADWIARAVGHGSAWAIPLASVVGIPAYLNGYAAIPLISGLIEMGMIPGAAMAFITAGAVSSVPAALAVYALVRKPVFVLYIVFGLMGSMVVGFFYQMTIRI